MATAEQEEEQGSTQGPQTVFKQLRGEGRTDLRRSFNSRPKAKPAKAIRHNGVTGTEEGSRYHRSVPPTALGPRTCEHAAKGREGALARRRHNSVDPEQPHDPTSSANSSG
jgi:hypothetical protein